MIPFVHSFGPLNGSRGPQQFLEKYRCNSMAFSGRELEDGDKILLPQSALMKLADMNVDYPMLFQLTNPAMDKKTHCGVYEFSAQEGQCYIPFWMMQNLMLGEGALISVKNVSLPKAKYVKFRPQSVDFLDISNPRAVLEKTLRNYTCVTTGDQICIRYLDKNLYLEVVEVKPNGAASIVETDCEVDFAEPVGYVPPPKPSSTSSSPSVESMGSSGSVISAPRTVQRARAHDEQAKAEENSKKFKPFSGKAVRVDGKPGNSPVDGVESKNDGTPPLPPSAPSSAAGAAAMARQSLVGNKYSKKKVAVSAFTGKAHTLK